MSSKGRAASKALVVKSNNTRITIFAAQERALILQNIIEKEGVSLISFRRGMVEVKWLIEDEWRWEKYIQQTDYVEKEKFLATSKIFPGTSLSTRLVKKYNYLIPFAKLLCLGFVHTMDPLLEKRVQIMLMGLHIVY